MDATALLAWFGAGGAGLGVDLTQGGSNDGLAFDIVSSNAVIDLFVRIDSGGGNYSDLLASLPEVPVGASGFVDFAFTSFAPTGAGADFGNVEQVVVTLSGPVGLYLALDSFAAISTPEPPVWLLLGLGLLVLVGRVHPGH